MATGAGEWIKIAESEQELHFNNNNLTEIDTPVRRICLGRFQNRLYAFASRCPHASASFVDGYIDAVGNVVCPLHRYKFCMSNGKNITGEGYYLKHWPVEVREDGVYVKLEKSKLFGLL